MKKQVSFILKSLFFMLIAGIVLFVILNRDKLSLDMILSRLPENLFLAAVILMLLYILKGLSVFFPILVLQIAGGLIFPPLPAMILNCVGTGLAYTAPYIIGRISGRDLTEKIISKHRKAGDLIKLQRGSKAFTSFILRAVSCLPADLVSLYLGSIGVPYPTYVIWSIVGTLPGLIPATFMGIEMTNPRSAAFVISVVATILSSLVSVIIYWIIQKRKGN